MFQLFISKSIGNIYYVIPYVGAIMAIHGKKDKASRLFLNDKMKHKHGNKPDFKAYKDIILNSISETIGSDYDLAVIPSSSLSPSMFQVILNNYSLIRTKEAPSRKENHFADIGNLHDSIKIDLTKTSDTLVIFDDIITTGKTVLAFKNLLSTLNYKTIFICCYGLSINITKADSLTVNSMGSGIGKKAKETKEDNSFVTAKQKPNRSTVITRKVSSIYRRAFSEVSLLDLTDRYENGYCYNYLTGGNIDALSFLKLVLRQQNLEYCLFSTWCMAIEDIYQFKDWIEAGRIKRLDAYVGEIFPGSYKAEYTLLLDVVKLANGKVVVFKNHSKVFAGYGDKFHFGIQTSANINTNPRCENACVQIGKDIFDFYKDYYDNIVSFQ